MGGPRKGYQAGYLSIETSGNLLSHRPASRPGDDVDIWSLLMSENTIFHDAEIFWKAMQGSFLRPSRVNGRLVPEGARISTGHLISSAPRLKTRDLGRAPTSPIFRLSSQWVTGGFNGFDGGDSGPGWITPDGLVADWLLWKFDRTLLWEPLDTKCLRSLSRVTAQFLQGYRWGAILCPIEQRGIVPKGRWWEDGGRLRRAIIVVCGTNEMDDPFVEKYTFNRTEPTKPKWDKNGEVVGWEWRGVYAWDDVELLPEMRGAKNFLIV